MVVLEGRHGTVRGAGKGAALLTGRGGLGPRAAGKGWALCLCRTREDCEMLKLASSWRSMYQLMSLVTWAKQASEL